MVCTHFAFLHKPSHKKILVGQFVSKNHLSVLQKSPSKPKYDSQASKEAPIVFQSPNEKKPNRLFLLQ